MSSPRGNTGSVLGKRSHQTTQVEQPDSTFSDLDNALALPTPDPTPNPKRAKTTGSVLDGDHNKENIPPFVLEAINASVPSSPRRTRSLRRTSTVIEGGSSRPGTPRRYASTSNLRQAVVATPATSLSHLSLFTPPSTPPSLLLPLHVRARALLRPTCNDGPQMAGREQERSEIEAFILGFIGNPSSAKDVSALYISGSPGTGKTALVNATLADLAGQLQDVRVLAVNCMALDGVDAVWQQLAELFGAGNKTPGRVRKAKDSPQQIVEKTLSSSKQKCLVVLDEMDHVASSAQALSPLFNLAHTFSASLRLIGIANTHTLTASSTTFSLQSLAGVQTLHFAPYTPEQLLSILQSRLAPLLGEKETMERTKKFLPTATLTLLAKKIAAQTGDVRAVLEVLRGAIDIAAIASTSDSLDGPSPAVTPSHILSALKAYAPAGKTTPASAPSAAAGIVRKASDSETVMKVRELGLQQRLVLLAAFLATKSIEAGVSISASPASSPCRSPVKRTQSSSTASSLEMGQLHAFYTTILGRADSGVFKPVSRSEFGDLAGVLEVVGLLTLSSNSSSLPSTPRKPGKKAFSRSTSFAGSSCTQEVRFVDGVRLHEVARGLGLGLDEAPADAREEEVRALYQREQARIAREAKARGHVSSEVVGFEETMED
ncbi:P-loop containing nucleoside triphosphate hydrolase protein [Dichomitus squalens]|uniref:P-loop containing nucleoside triphosphate hydrolase protein n=1 Tax=Dichomitus squalens TaxID=114155 RepID=A0A4Q9MSK7_9APHY|nr:P-loop containing nucleoside triphosphate hydrolase protein [Dichomitus squalens]